jgi:hypothetical protein
MAQKKKEETVEISKVALYSVLEAFLTKRIRKFTGRGGSRNLMFTLFGPEIVPEEKMREIKSFFREYQKSQRPERVPIPQSERIEVAPEETND